MSEVVIPVVSAPAGAATAVGDPNSSDAVEILKKRLAVLCCDSILNPPIEFVGALRIKGDDTEEQMAVKRKEHDEKTKKRELERIRREPEIVEEMNNIMKRILLSRNEPLPDDGGEYDFGVMRDNKLKVIGSGAAGSMPTYYCEVCRNKSEEFFVVDTTSGDTICQGVNGSGCGNVVAEHLINRGAEKRNFEGEEDRNHFGPAPDKLMTDAENMRTGMALAAGAPLGGTEGQLLNKFSQTSADIEMNLSKIGHDERAGTRVGYKTKHKKRAFELIDQMSANFGIHSLVIMRARQEFSRFRDVRETIQQFEGVVAACIIIAYQELMRVVGVEGLKARRRVFKAQEAPRVSAKSDLLLRDDVDGFGADSAIGKWSTEEMKSWLERVLSPAAEDCQGFVRFICQHVDGKLAQAPDESRKRKYPTGTTKIACFGTTTVESRKSRLTESLKRRAPSAGTGAGHPEGKLAGQVLVNMDVEAVYDEYRGSTTTSSTTGTGGQTGATSDLVRMLRAAIHGRVQFESARSVARHEAELEAVRLYTERANGVLNVYSVAEGVSLEKSSSNYTRHHFNISPTNAVDEPPAKKQATETVPHVPQTLSLPEEVVDMDSLFNMSSDIMAAAQKAEEKQAEAEAAAVAKVVAPKAKSRFKVVRQRSGESEVNVGMDSST